ncbi:hypothetical protein LINGRAHAP2_LOCUS11286 [Linum grandiflorum]
MPFLNTSSHQSSSFDTSSFHSCRLARKARSYLRPRTSHHRLSRRHPQECMHVPWVDASLYDYISSLHHNIPEILQQSLASFSLARSVHHLDLRGAHHRHS